MSDIAQDILGHARKHLEKKDRRGEAIPDYRDSEEMRKFIGQAEQSGPISALKAPQAHHDLPTYLDGVEAFVNSNEFKSFAKQKSGQSHLFEWDPSSSLLLPDGTKGLNGRKTASLTTVSTIRDLLTTERSGEIITLGVRQTRLRTLFSNIPTSGSSVKTLRETGFTNNASTRPENVDPGSTTPALQSAIATDVVTTNVETIDHAIAFPKELMDDLPALIAWLRQRGVDGIDDVEDSMILSGAGSGSNEFLGLLTNASVPEYDWSDGAIGDNMADAVLGAMTQLISAEYMADHVLLSPVDHALIAKMKDTNGNYLFPAAHRQDAEFSLWGVPTSRTTALSTGDAVTGAFRRAATYRPRQAIGYRITDSHASHFLDGVYWMVIERRAAFETGRPESFREIDFDNAPA